VSIESQYRGIRRIHQPVRLDYLMVALRWKLGVDALIVSARQDYHLDAGSAW